MGKPGARRLLEAVKKKRSKLRHKHIVSGIKLLTGGNVGSQPKISKNGYSKKSSPKSNFDITSSTLTCLIQEKVSTN